jgi:hypothetical protein
MKDGLLSSIVKIKGRGKTVINTNILVGKRDLLLGGILDSDCSTLLE